MITEKPEPPAGPLAISGYDHDSVSLAWKPPQEDTWLETYRIEKREVSRPIWETVDRVDSSDSSYTVRRLAPERDYFFRVISESNLGASAPLALAEPFTPRRRYQPPAAPGGPLEILEITRDTVTISWGAPMFDGGAAISAYIIERREVTRTQWYRVARVKAHHTSYRITNLVEHTEYVFRVYAENIEGLSEPLILSKPVLVRRPVSKYNQHHFLVVVYTVYTFCSMEYSEVWLLPFTIKSSLIDDLYCEVVFNTDKIHAIGKQEIYRS